MKKIHLTITGKTVTDKFVIGNVFQFIDTLGLPLSVVYDHLQDNDMVIDWNEFVNNAIKAKWNIDTIYSRCIDAMRFPYEKKTFDKYWSNK
jgi:hypothetical protein